MSNNKDEDKVKEIVDDKEIEIALTEKKPKKNKQL